MNRIIKQRTGFTILEFTIAMGISSFIIGISMYFLEDNKKFQRVLGQKIEKSADLTLGRALMYRDMRAASPTFYFFSGLGDFYELSEFGEAKPSNCETVSGDTKEFWYTTIRPACRGLHIVLDEVGDKLSLVVENTSLGKGGFLLSPEDVFDADDNLSKNSLHNILEANGLPKVGNYKVQASSSLLVGSQMQVYGAIFDASTLALVSKGELYNIPQAYCDVSTLTDQNIGTLSDFLKCLPGTGLPRVKVSPVNMVNYEIKTKKVKSRDVKYLERSSTRIGRANIGVGLLQNLTSIRFYRPNSSSTSVYLDINFETIENK